MVELSACAPPCIKDADKFLLPNFLLNSGNLNHLRFAHAGFFKVGAWRKVLGLRKHLGFVIHSSCREIMKVKHEHSLSLLKQK